MATKKTKPSVTAQEPRSAEPAAVSTLPVESGVTDDHTPSDVELMAADVEAGKYGHGLKLVAALGDDFAEVMKAVATAR